MYKFNSLLYKNLSRLVGMSQYNFSLMIFGNKRRYLMPRGIETNLKVTELVNICNTLRISFSHFISMEDSDAYTDDLSKYIIDERIFKSVRFNYTAMKRMYGKGSLTGFRQKEDFARQIGISAMSVYLYTMPETCTMKVKTLFDICNRFGINIDVFIDDPNTSLPQNNELLNSAMIEETLKKEVLRLRNDIKESKLRIIELSNENERLKISAKNNIIAEDAVKRHIECPSIRKWIFNRELLDSLPVLIGISKDRLFKDIGMSNPSIAYDNGNITVRMLVDLCNRHAISSRHFFFRDAGNDNRIKGITYYQNTPFNPVSFHPEFIKNIFGKNSLTGKSLSEILQILGYSPNKIKKWRDEDKSSMRVDDMVELCNTLDVSPFCFISDSNKVDGYNVTQAEFFLEENRMLRTEIIRLNEEIKSLKKKRN